MRPSAAVTVGLRGCLLVAAAVIAVPAERAFAQDGGVADGGVPEVVDAGVGAADAGVEAETETETATGTETATETETDTGTGEAETATESETEGEEAEVPNASSRLSSVAPHAEGVPWTASLMFDQSWNVRGFRRRAQLSYDPTYTWLFSPRVRYIVSEELSIGARQDLTIEMTQSNVTTTTRDPWWDDTRLDASYVLPPRPLDLIFTLSGTVRLPTSLVARASRRILGPGAALTVMRAFDLLEGFVVQGSLAYTFWISASDVLRVRQPYPCNLAGSGSNDDCTASDGFATVRDIYSASIVGSLVPIDGLTIYVGLAGIWSRANRLPDACVDLGGGAGPDPTCFGDGGRKWRALDVFQIGASYDVRRWLTLAVTYGTLAIQPDLDGRREHLFYNENTAISLTTTFRADVLYAEHKER